MSIQFGICQPEGQNVGEPQMRTLSWPTMRYSTDGTAIRVQGCVGMGFQPYCTHERSRLEVAPATHLRGNLLTFDGRLDNYRELCALLGFGDKRTPDSEIVLAAFEAWGEDCFSRLVGDWALALWIRDGRSLYLARDHAGTRTLYFSSTEETVLWSTYLDTFFAELGERSLDDAYAACYLAGQPLRDLTPYKGIRAVLPAHFVVFRNGEITQRRHWRWFIDHETRLNTDAEYDEQFLALFRQSVERRTGPGAPLLAQLSGGMDSSSIVCMSDRIRTAQNGHEAELLETMSFLDDTEPSWDERPYISIIEASRGKQGIHFPASFLDYGFDAPGRTDGTYFQPGADRATTIREKAFEDAIAGKGFRSILSGIGGDEVLGGSPNPLPELASALTAGQFTDLFKRTVRWCVADRTPVLYRLFATAHFTYRIYARHAPGEQTLPLWLSPSLRQLCSEREKDDFVGRGHAGFSPTAVHNGLTWWTLLETMPHLKPGLLARREYRYPYLDRDLVEYLFSVPRDQLVRPGRRRSLMRRALRGIVPSEILERRRKAYITRGPLEALTAASHEIARLLDRSLIFESGYVDVERLRSSIALVQSGRSLQDLSAVFRALMFELWLQHIAAADNSQSASDSQQQVLLPFDGAHKLHAG